MYTISELTHNLNLDREDLWAMVAADDVLGVGTTRIKNIKGEPCKRICLVDDEPGPCAYLAGPMTGIPDWNHPAFNAAAERLRESGYTVLNPADGFDGDTTLARRTYMRRAVENLLTADVIFLLPGWSDSAGARLEEQIAQELGLDIVHLAGDELWSKELHL